jgi:lipopolysaccharide exporter
MKSIANRLIKGTVWLSISRAIISGLSILSTLVLARLLLPADFGLVAIATTVLLLMTEVTELSLSAALIRHRDPTRAHFDTAWTMNALRGVFLGGLFAAAGIPVANFYEDPRLIPVMAALGFSVFLSGLGNPRRFMLQRELIFHQEFILNVAQRLAGVITSITFAYIYRSYWALVVGTIVAQVVNVIVSYSVLPFRPRITFVHMKELLSFSVWLTAGQIVNTLNWRFDYLVVGKLLGHSTLGHYSVGSTLASIPTRESTGPLKQAFFPGFSSIQHDAKRLAAAYQRAQAFITAVALPTGIGAALIADPLIRLALGEKWEPAIFIVQALAAVYALQTLGSLVDSLGMAKGKTRILFIRSLQMLFVRIPIIIAAMWFFGLVGLVYSRVFTGLLGVWVNMNLIHRLTGVTPGDQIRANTRSLASVSVMATGVMLLSQKFADSTDASFLMIKIAVLMIVGVSVYCGTTWFLWVLMRKPSGPEQEVGRMFGKLKNRLGF